MHNDIRPTDRQTDRQTDISIYRAPMELKITFETHWGIPVYKCVYRYTVRIPVYRAYTGVVVYQVPILQIFLWILANLQQFFVNFWRIL